MTNIIHNENAHTGLLKLPKGIARTCVTSPPYYGLRDYGHPDQIGLEETPEQFIQKLVEVFRGVKHALADDGTLWVNIGDTYAANRVYQVPQTKDADSRRGAGEFNNMGMKVPDGLKPKDLIGIPWMLAFALRADGWYLRQDIIWHKPNPMPESVTDRCTKSHEYIFLLSKYEKYYYDFEAVKEPCVWDLTGTMTDKNVDRAKENHKAMPTAMKNGIRPKKKEPQTFGGKKARKGQIDENDPRFRNGSEQWGRVWEASDSKRNKRSVWTIPVKPFKEAHFATFPTELISPCIQAGSAIGDVVLDPFMGSGTTAEVSLRLQRKYIGFEINPEYIAISDKRLNPFKNTLFTK
jgi:DNA modification methylase